MAAELWGRDGTGRGVFKLVGFPVDSEDSEFNLSPTASGVDHRTSCPECTCHRLCLPTALIWERLELRRLTLRVLTHQPSHPRIRLRGTEPANARSICESATPPPRSADGPAAAFSDGPRVAFHARPSHCAVFARRKEAEGFTGVGAAQ